MFSLLDIFRIRKKINEYKTRKKLEQEVRITYAKERVFSNIEDNAIQYRINPFIDVQRIKDEKVYVEEIDIYHPELTKDFKPLYHILKDPYIQIKERKQFVLDVIQKWEYDYYKNIDKELKKILDQSAYIPVKKIVKITNRKINSYILLALLFLFLLKQYSILQMIKYIGPIFASINTTLIYPHYHNVAVIVFYLSIVISMYLIIVKVYFDKVLKYGLSAKGFLIKERDRMLRKFHPNVKRLKKHLFLIIKKHKIEDKYEMNTIYNSKTVVKRIQRYGRNVINRVGIFTSYYSQIIFVSKVLRLILILLILYLVYGIFSVNKIITF